MVHKMTGTGRPWDGRVSLGPVSTVSSSEVKALKHQVEKAFDGEREKVVVRARPS